MISVLGKSYQATYFYPPDTPDTNTKETICYNECAQIDSENFPSITKVKCSQNNKMYVIKNKNINNEYNSIEHESNILQHLNTQSSKDPENKTYIITLIALFSLNHKSILLLPFYKKDLFDLIEDKGALPLDQTLIFGKQLMKALIFLKQHLVIHRDIKPENIVITDEENLKLIDFEYSVRTDQSFLIKPSGTIEYYSPELIENPNPNFPSDMWAAAYTIFIMNTGDILFEGTDLTTLKKDQESFFSNPSPFDPIIPDSSLKMNQFKNALTQMMAPDFTKRSSPENGLDLLSEIESSPPEGAAKAGQKAEY